MSSGGLFALVVGITQQPLQGGVEAAAAPLAVAVEQGVGFSAKTRANSVWEDTRRRRCRCSRRTTMTRARTSWG